MATLSNTVTLLDIAKSIDPDGKPAKVVELLTQSNPILEVMPFMEGNLPTGHQTTIRTGLPDVVWRKYNQGVAPSKSNRIQVTETCGMLEARSEVDVKLANLYGDKAAFRLSEAMAFVEAMNQQMADAFFYGTQPDTPFTGIAPRYNALTGSAVSDYILDAGGSGADQTSIYVMVLGENTVHGIYPKGSTAGIKHQDLGEIDAFDADNKRFRAYADLWQWDVGLVVRDHRAIVRIGNIEASDLLAAGLSGGNTQAATAATNILRQLAIAKHRIPRAVRGAGRMVAFANSRVVTALRLIGLEKSASALGLAAAFDQPRPDGIQILECDAILNTEAEIV